MATALFKEVKGNEMWTYGDFIVETPRGETRCTATNALWDSEEHADGHAYYSHDRHQWLHKSEILSVREV